MNYQSLSYNDKQLNSNVNTIRYTIFCPGCKNLETVEFFSGRLVNTPKFKQSGKEIYHNCGYKSPCRLYK